MDKHVDAVLGKAEEIAASGDATKTLALLRQLNLQQFGEILISLPNVRYPNISRILPRMASAEVQRNWTGNDGIALLRQTNSFVDLLSRTVDLKSVNRVLDFGCGYGRILRAFYYYVDPDRLYGCDPWDESIRLCREADILGHLAISDYLPTRLPFEEKFDLTYAFSVFTHLSERATRACLTALVEASTGIIAITIRPPQYWDFNLSITTATRDHLLVEHNAGRFAFSPHTRSPIDGDITYGDSSFSIDWLKAHFSNLEVIDTRSIPGDPLQTLVLLRRRSS